MRVKETQARAWYANEAATQSWSVRALDRQISTLYYERLLGSQKQDGVRGEAVAKIAAEAPTDPRDFIRDPYVLEFLGVQPNAGLYEQDIEKGLIDRLQQHDRTALHTKAVESDEGNTVCATCAGHKPFG